MLRSVPADQLEAVIARTTVPQEHRRTSSATQRQPCWRRWESSAWEAVAINSCRHPEDILPSHRRRHHRRRPLPRRRLKSRSRK